MTFGFSTLGDPLLSYPEFLALARTFDLDFVELRILEDTLDLPAYFRAHPPVPSPNKPRVRVISSSLHLSVATPDAIAEAVAFAEVADLLHAPFLRVFGGGQTDQPLTEEELNAAATAIETLRARLVECGLTVEPLLETHDAFSFSPACLALNRRLKNPLGIIWDSHHTWKLGGEPLEESWRALEPFIRHVHYKDSVPSGDTLSAYTYVLPGKGHFPTADLFQLLARKDFNGGVSLEWEKKWHPQLPPLTDALLAFARVSDQGEGEEI